MFRFTTACFWVACALVSNTSHAGTLVHFRTVFGNIEVELYDNDKPVTVRNFLNYIQSGRYENEFAHRLVPGFVIQGGGFTVTNYGATNWQTLSVPSFGPITNEFSVGRQFSNLFGTIAMAKVGGDTNSATSQWFFNLTNNAFLDAPDTNHLFVVFGHVIAGTNILNTFNTFQNWLGFPPPATTNLVVYHLYTSPFDTLPVLYTNLDNRYRETNFVYIDISLFRVDIQPGTGGGQQISWDSAAGLTNVVQFTTNLPPVWNTLAVTNGTGARMTVADNTAGTNRFYRVRVPFP